MPLIERFHPNLEQAVEEEYLEADDNDGSSSRDEDANQRSSLPSTPSTKFNAEASGSGSDRKVEEYQSGSGDSDDSDDSGDSGDDSGSADSVEQDEESGDQSSGESGAEDSGAEDSGASGDEEDSGESGDEESGDEDAEDREDGQQGLSLLRNLLSIKGVL